MRYSVFVVAFALGIATHAHAQQATAARGEIVVRVRVVDSAGVPLSGADVSIVRGIHTQIAAGATNAGGERVLRAPRDDEPYQVVARRIGYQRAEQFFARPASDTIAMQIVLNRTPPALATVNVTAQENRSRIHYHVDADEIANTKTLLLDGTDILTRLRPEMMGSRDCSLKYIWVNGKRIIYAPRDEIAMMRHGKTPPVAPPQTLVLQGDGSSGRAQPAGPTQYVADDPWLVLASIHPEHILEVNHIDCFIADPVHKNGSEQALYVALKPGVDFEPGVGSFVVDTARKATDLPPLRSAVARPDARLTYRYRLLGVYDPRTGDPVTGAEVIDLATGLRGHTSQTGTISLYYLPEGKSSIRIHHDGYRDEDMDVVIAPDKMSPITIVLTPLP